MKALSFVLLFIFGMGFAAPAWAFPEMIRHGYTSCMTCHVSPNGGGLMTPYGRSMSKEILSRHAYEGEERLFHGALDAEGGTRMRFIDPDLEVMRRIHKLVK